MWGLRSIAEAFTGEVDDDAEVQLATEHNSFDNVDEVAEWLAELLNVELGEKMETKTGQPRWLVESETLVKVFVSQRGTGKGETPENGVTFVK